MSTRFHDRSSPRLDDVVSRLPSLEGVRPIVDQLLATSVPDAGRRWTASGEMGTAGSRVVDLDAMRATLGRVIESESARVVRRLERVALVTEALVDGAWDAAMALLLEEAGVLESEGRSEEARAFAEAAARLGIEEGSPRAGEALRRAARCARSCGALADAVTHYESAWHRALDHDRLTDAVIAATGRGNVSVDRGQWADADRWYHRAMEVLESEPGGVPSDEAAGLRWRLFQNLGITARERGAMAESAAWYGRAESESAGLGDPAAMIEVQNGIGQLDLARGEPRRAEVRFRRALSSLDELTVVPDAVRVAIRVNLGEALLRQGRTLEAGDAARGAEAEALRGRFFGRLPETYRLLARVVRARGEIDAFVFLDRAIDLIRAHGLPPYEEALTLRLYADLRADEGEEELAKGARERASQISDIEPDGDAK